MNVSTLSSRFFGRLLALVTICVAKTSWVQGQFDSHSDNSDGPLDLTGTASGTVVELDPDHTGDNIFNFTYIKIPAGVTVKLGVKKLQNAPVYWLAQGPVEIEGTVDLSGSDGHDAAPGKRAFSTPGPGGFPGGLGAAPGISPTFGYGPGGSRLNGYNGCFYLCNISNLFLMPLVGGSGGGGYGPYNASFLYGAGGGAGGGAILIASSASVSIEGKVSSNGGMGGKGGADGNTPYAGNGSGGAIRILAPAFSGRGTLEVKGGQNFNFGFGDQGRIRVETTDNRFAGTITGYSRVVTLSSNVIFLPASNSIAKVRAVKVGGVSVPLSPTGSFVVPDVAINQSGAVVVEIKASNIPLGTLVNLEIDNETLGNVSYNSTGLTGTLADSSATVTLNPFPSGYSYVFVHAKW